MEQSYGIISIGFALQFIRMQQISAHDRKYIADRNIFLRRKIDSIPNVLVALFHCCAGVNVGSLPEKAQTAGYEQQGDRAAPKYFSQRFRRSLLSAGAA